MLTCTRCRFPAPQTNYFKWHHKRLLIVMENWFEISLVNTPCTGEACEEWYEMPNLGAKTTIMGVGGSCPLLICMIAFTCVDWSLMGASLSSLILHIRPQGERDKDILAPKTKAFYSSKHLQGHCSYYRVKYSSSVTIILSIAKKIILRR